MSGLAGGAEVRAAVDSLKVDRVSMERSGQYMTVGMTMDLSDVKVEGNRAVLLTPRIVNGADSVELPSVGIYGRRRYFYYVRNNESMLTGMDEITYRAANKPDSVVYKQVLPYEDWMNGASLTVDRREYGCCSTILDEQTGTYGSYAEQIVEMKFFPDLVYVRPEAEAQKTRALEGSANIDFPVNQTAIHPDYRRNTVELGKIRSTIDSVRSDRDITITSVWLKGYASPDGPYANNRKLAIGRTEALKDYIGKLYNFDGELIDTDYEAEAWDELRRYVAQSTLKHKEEILAIIDSDSEPDQKERKIKNTYREEYRFLLENCYPSLRHTDYRIAYTIRDYSDVEEIERVLHSRPQNLSLNEFNLVAQRYEPGSEAFTEVYETAVRMYPSDPTANLNAANAAMLRGANAAAERYLAKAGDSAEAVYARGALAIRNEQYDAAREYLRRAADMGLEQAATTLGELDKRVNKNK